MWVKAAAEGSPGCVESETQGPRGSFVFTPVEERHGSSSTGSIIVLNRDWSPSPVENVTVKIVQLKTSTRSLCNIVVVVPFFERVFSRFDKSSIIPLFSMFRFTLSLRKIGGCFLRRRSWFLLEISIMLEWFKDEHNSPVWTTRSIGYSRSIVQSILYEMETPLFESRINLFYFTHFRPLIELTF